LEEVEEEEQEERSLEDMLEEEEEERREMESFPPDEFVDPEDEEEEEEERGEGAGELVASTSAAARKPRAAAGSEGPTLSQQLKAIKAVLASKVAELDAANALLVHVPNNLRESLPNPDVFAPVFVPPAFGSGETLAASQAKVNAAANSDQQRQLREELEAPKVKAKVCSTQGCNTILLPSGPMASKKCPACQQRGGRPPVAPPPAAPRTSAAVKACAGLGLKGAGVKKR